MGFLVYLIFSGILIYMLFRRGGFYRANNDKKHNHEEYNNSRHQSSHTGKNENIVMVKDPVCGKYILPDTALKGNVDGKAYFFCGEYCRYKFLKGKSKSA